MGAVGIYALGVISAVILHWIWTFDWSGPFEWFERALPAAAMILIGGFAAYEVIKLLLAAAA